MGQREVLPGAQISVLCEHLLSLEMWQHVFLTVSIRSSSIRSCWESCHLTSTVYTACNMGNSLWRPFRKDCNHFLLQAVYLQIIFSTLRALLSYTYIYSLVSTKARASRCEISVLGYNGKWKNWWFYTLQDSTFLISCLIWKTKLHRL